MTSCNQNKVSVEFYYFILSKCWFWGLDSFMIFFAVLSFATLNTTYYIINTLTVSDINEIINYSSECIVFTSLVLAMYKKKIDLKIRVKGGNRVEKGEYEIR